MQTQIVCWSGGRQHSESASSPLELTAIADLCWSHLSLPVLAIFRERDVRNSVHSLSLVSTLYWVSSPSPPFFQGSHVPRHWSKALSPSGHTVDALKMHSCSSAARYIRTRQPSQWSKQCWGWWHWGTGAFSRLQGTLGDTFPSGQLRDGGRCSRWP